jgi:hypothetical protein
MSNGYPVPRQLTKLELVDIHLLVKTTHPHLGIPPLYQSEPKCSPKSQQ